MKNEATILENDLRRFFAVRRLSYFVKRFYGEDHPTSKAIAENLADASHANLHFPSQPMTKVAYAKYVASLAKATSIYKQLGPNERRAIFNGWNARDPMMGWPEDSNYKPVPFLDFDPLTSDGLIITGDYGEWHRGNAVTLRIKEGATLPEVLAALDELSQQVPRWFHRCIADDEWQGQIEAGGKRRREVNP